LTTAVVGVAVGVGDGGEVGLARVAVACRRFVVTV